MEPQGSYSKPERQPQGGGQRGSQEPAIVHQPKGDDLHLEPILGGHAAEDTFFQWSVDDRPEDAKVPRENARIVLDAVVLFPLVCSLEGAHGAREKDRGV